MTSIITQCSECRMKRKNTLAFAGTNVNGEHNFPQCAVYSKIVQRIISECKCTKIMCYIERIEMCDCLFLFKERRIKE